MAENTEAAPAPAKSKLKLILVVVAVIILAVGLSVAGTFWFLQAPAETDGDDAKAAEAEEAFQPARYYVVSKPLVSGVQSEGRQRYVQVYIAFAARDKKALAGVELHLPLIRNQLLSVLNSQGFAELQTPQGRDKMINALLTTVNQSLEAEDEPPVEQVLFRNFVLQ